MPLVEEKLAWDDTLEFNTQGSSQWDSLVHMQHMPSGLAYNGLQVTEEALTGSQTTAENTLPSLDHWHSRGGLVGRGVLVDFKGYMDEQGKPYHAFEGYRITVDDVEAVAKHQGVEFRHGDILIIRTGATEVMENPTPDDFTKLQQMKLSGLHGTEDTARWVWNNHFSAVASDSAAFEAFPPLRPDGTEGLMSELGELRFCCFLHVPFPVVSLSNGEISRKEMADRLVLHQYFLSLFGLSIGELWDLKRLSAYCQKTGRYSFLLTSAPLNHPGLVGSPPNALAIF